MTELTRIQNEIAVIKARHELKKLKQQMASYPARAEAARKRNRELPRDSKGHLKRRRTNKR